MCYYPNSTTPPIPTQISQSCVRSTDQTRLIMDASSFDPFVLPLERSSPLTVSTFLNSLKILAASPPNLQLQNRRLLRPLAATLTAKQTLLRAANVPRQNTPLLLPPAATQQQIPPFSRQPFFCSLMSATPRWGGAQPRILRAIRYHFPASNFHQRRRLLSTSCQRRTSANGHSETRKNPLPRPFHSVFHRP